jgi:hypothetical protein
MTNRWRYLVTKAKVKFWGQLDSELLQAELDRQGNQGWELVEIVPGPQGWGDLHLVFKKPG